MAEKNITLVDDVKEEEPVVDLELDLSATRRKRIRINGDNSRIIELNLSDMLLTSRLKEEYDKLGKYIDEVVAVTADDDNSDEALASLADKLKDIDKKMRECVDRIFDYPVCKVCAPEGSMYDPFNGTFRFEHIIKALLGYYNENVTAEYNKIKNKVNRAASKYTKKKR